MIQLDETKHNGTKRNGKLLAKKHYTHSRYWPIGHTHSGRGVKANKTLVCTNYKCGYSKRIRILQTVKDVEYSKDCPKCKVILADIGNKAKLPKLGSIQRKRLMYAILQCNTAEVNQRNQIIK